MSRLPVQGTFGTDELLLGYCVVDVSSRRRFASQTTLDAMSYMLAIESAEGVRTQSMALLDGPTPQVGEEIAIPGLRNLTRVVSIEPASASHSTASVQEKVNLVHVKEMQAALHDS